MATEHFSGLQISQRGITYYITRTSNIRGTAGYELYTYDKWNNSEPLNVTEQNPKYTYRLFSDKWYPWVTVAH